jgi:hypothetical protein
MAPITIKYRQNTDTMPTQYRLNTDIQHIPLSLFPSTCTLHFFKSTHPSVCPLLPMHRGMSAFMTSASSGAHAGLSCTVYAPNPPSEKYKVQQESARSLTSIRISQVLSLSLSLSLAAGSFSLSFYLSIYLSLYFDLLSRSWSRSWWLLLTLTLGVLSESRKYMLVSVWFCLLPSATDESTSQGRVMCEHY